MKKKSKTKGKNIKIEEPTTKISSKYKQQMANADDGLKSYLFLCCCYCYKWLPLLAYAGADRQNMKKIYMCMCGYKHENEYSCVQ